MKRLFAIFLLVCSAGIIDRVVAQVPEQDVIILKDNTILRGTIMQAVTPGSPVVIQKTSGKTSSVLWSEILTIRRLPASLPDSAITALFVGEEDVLVLKSGRIMRGALVESSKKEMVGFLTARDTFAMVQKSDINKTLHLEKGLSDSTIDVLYVHPPPEMIADDFRILTVFGGVGLIAGDLAAPTPDGAPAAGSGYGIGLHVSLRVVPSVRWATTAIYGRHSMGLPEPVNSWTATGSGPMRATWVLTGLEVRAEGVLSIKAFGIVQGGIFAMKLDGAEFSYTPGFNHGAGTGTIQQASCNSFAFCLGGGISMGRLSLSARWLASSATYSQVLTLKDQYGGTQQQNNYNQGVTVILISLGVTII